MTIDFLIGAIRASRDLHPLVKMELEEILYREEPRVLTLDEAMHLKKRDRIWLEYTGCHRRLFMLTVGRVRRFGLTFFQHLPCPWEKYGKAPDSELDWTWRIWTNEPTDEQMATETWT